MEFQWIQWIAFEVEKIGKNRIQSEKIGFYRKKSGFQGNQGNRRRSNLIGKNRKNRKNRNKSVSIRNNGRKIGKIGKSE